jgi:hypothetical protein
MSMARPKVEPDTLVSCKAICAPVLAFKPLFFILKFWLEQN